MTAEGFGIRGGGEEDGGPRDEVGRICCGFSAYLWWLSAMNELIIHINTHKRVECNPHGSLLERLMFQDRTVFAASRQFRQGTRQASGIRVSDMHD